MSISNKPISTPGPPEKAKKVVFDAIWQDREIKFDIDLRYKFVTVYILQQRYFYSKGLKKNF